MGYPKKSSLFLLEKTYPNNFLTANVIKCITQWIFLDISIPDLIRCQSILPGWTSKVSKEHEKFKCQSKFDLQFVSLKRYWKQLRVWPKQEVKSSLFVISIKKMSFAGVTFPKYWRVAEKLKLSKKLQYHVLSSKNLANPQPKLNWWKIGVSCFCNRKLLAIFRPLFGDVVVKVTKVSKNHEPSRLPSSAKKAIEKLRHRNNNTGLRDLIFVFYCSKLRYFREVGAGRNIWSLQRPSNYKMSSRVSGYFRRKADQENVRPAMKL